MGAMLEAVANDPTIDWREARDADAVAIWAPGRGLPGTSSGEASPSEWMADWMDLEPERWLRRIPGRETLRVRTPDGQPVVVKRYSGDLVRDAWHERLRGRAPRSPARREFENLIGLAAAGVQVPAPIALCEARGRQDRRSSVVVMSHVEHDETLVERFASGLAGRERERRLLLELVVRLHDAGWYHRDLYLQHLLWCDGPVLIDVGRARQDRRPRQRWFVKDLAALWHSAPSTVTVDEAQAFLGDYLDARAGDVGAPGRWGRRVAKKARRIARHAPRFVDDGGSR